MKKIIQLWLMLCLVSISVVKGQVTDTLKLNIFDGLKQGSISADHTPFDIGHMLLAFDGYTTNPVRTPAINPLILTLTFNKPLNILASRLFMMTPGTWGLETAANLQDMDTKSGSYHALFENDPVFNAVWDSASFTPVSAKVIRLTAFRTEGDNYVHLNEWELYVIETFHSIKICPDVTTLIPGASRHLSAYGVDSQNNRLFLEPSSVSWGVQNASVASVSSLGKVNALSTGSTNVTASYRSLSGSATVQVIPSFTPVLAEKKRVKVALVIENPQEPSAGNKRWHELFGWLDPASLAAQIAHDLTEASNGTVEFEITTIDGSPQFSRLDGSLLSPQFLFEKFSEPGGFDSLLALANAARVHYDYEAMINYYDFCTKREAGIYDEIWIYSHPIAGLSESKLAGKNAFFYNSTPLTNTSCIKLLPITGLNYATGTDDALHSFIHRVENAMWVTYGRWVNPDPRPNDFELFTRVELNTPNLSHVGNSHIPPNGVEDYDFGNKTLVTNYADNWFTYPQVTKQTRSINCDEWACTQIGFVRWWFRHLPRYHGVTNGVLNDWWHYLTDFEGATALAKAANNGCENDLSLREPENPTNVDTGLNYAYYQGYWRQLPDFNTLTPIALGNIATVDLAPQRRANNFALRYTGFVEIPTDGTYTFYTTSDDGSKLYIGHTLVVDNDGAHAVKEASGTIGLKKGKHAITIDFFQAWGGQVLRVDYAGPGIAKQVISSTAFFREPSDGCGNDLALREPENPANVATGLNYAYYEGYWRNLPDFNMVTPIASGNIATVDLYPKRRGDNFAFRYTGFVEVPANCIYTFYTTSDDGSKLYIGHTLVVDNDGAHAVKEASGRIGLKKGKHAITIDFFQSWGGQVLRVDYESAGIAKQVISSTAFFREPSDGQVTHEEPARLGLQSDLANQTIYQSGISIFPNPIHEQVTIKLPQGGEQGAKVTLMSMNQMRVHTQEMTSTEAVFDLKVLPAGMYIIMIENSQQKVIHRIIKH
ncbi:MAG: PA14 domain-containing protein [Bacteroidota bacterium]